MAYTYIWEYIVREDKIEEFVEAYNSDGLWVQLFKKSPGYITTDLIRDRRNPRRFVTIDRWESFEHWQQFRDSQSAEFEALDEKCESYTESETELGRFEAQ